MRGGGGPEVTLPKVEVEVDLEGTGLEAGTITIGAGESREAGTRTLSCAAGGSDCTLTVVQDPETEELTATATGGTLTVMQKVDLQGSRDLNAGTTTIRAGESVTTGRTTITCAEGGDDCGLTVTADPVTGNQTATATGGTLTVTVTTPPDPEPVDLQGSTDLTAGTTTIPAGEEVTKGRTTLACAAEGEACQLTVQVDPVTGLPTATATGGTLTVAVAPVPPPPAPAPTPPTPEALTLPAVHDLKKGTVIIKAGQTYTAGGTVVSCPAGDTACTVTISDGPGGLVGTTTGGTATVSLVPFPTWTRARGKAVDTAINTNPSDPALTTNDSGKNSATKLDLDEILVSEQGVPSIAAGTRPEAQRFTDVGAAPALTGWTGRVFERPQAQGATQRVVVYTNRAASPNAYYRMGWWMNEPQAADGAYTARGFSAAPLGAAAAINGRQAGITGTATYAGSAVGLYSLRPRTNVAMRAGSFTATASLTADFGADTIEGAITGFRDEKGAAIPGWAVHLNATNLGTAATQGTTSGVGAGGLGWTGTFQQIFADQAGVNDRPPNHAYGTFHARVGARVPNTGPYSSVQGAFATDKTE